MTDQNARLAAYVDGELHPDEVQEIERQLATDPQARQIVRMHRKTTALLRGACAQSFYADAPERLRQTLEHVPPASVPLRLVTAIAASLLLAVIGFAAGMYVGRGLPVSEMAALLDEASGYHLIYARESEHLVEIPASRKEELAAWLGERLGRKVVIPDLSASGLTFAGGRMLVVNNKPVAQLLYTQPGEMPVGFCITQSSEAASNLQMERRQGLDLAWWNEGGYIYLIVGVLPGDRAKMLADRIVAASRG